MGSIFAYSLLAGLAPLLSSSIPFITLRNRNVTPSVFHILLCISAGLLFAVATLELIPESIDLSLRSINEGVGGSTTNNNNNKKILSTKFEKDDGGDDISGIFSLSDIDDLQIAKLNENKLINQDNDDHNDDEEEDHDHDHDHEDDEKKHKLRTPLYGLGFGFAILIIVESIFSGIDGGHHSHSHGIPIDTDNNKNDIISDDDHDHHHHHHHHDHDEEEDSHELLEKNNKSSSGSNSSVINNSSSSNDDVLHNNNSDTPDSVSTPNHDSSSNSSSSSTSKNRNKNDSNNNSNNNNKIDIKNSSSGSSGSSGSNGSNNKSKLTITTFIALSIHSFVDGVVISSAFTSSPHVGARVALAIVIHKIPDGLVLSSIILSQKKFTSSIIGGNPLFSNPFFYFLLISCMTPLGAFISSFLFGGLSISSGSFVLGFGAGTFLYITSTAILPEILSSQIVKKSTSLISMFLGYLLFIFLDSTFHGAH